MVNQEKVRLIARAEQYRQREKRKALWINRHSRRAYVSQQMVKSLIFCTVGAVIVVVMWAIYNSEWLLSIYDMEKLSDLTTKVLIMYGAAMLLTAAVSWRTYRSRYTKARSSVKKYYMMLRKLNDYYEKSRKRLAGSAPERKEGEQ